MWYPAFQAVLISPYLTGYLFFLKFAPGMANCVCLKTHGQSEARKLVGALLKFLLGKIAHCIKEIYYLTDLRIVGRHYIFLDSPPPPPLSALRRPVIVDSLYTLYSMLSFSTVVRFCVFWDIWAARPLVFPDMSLVVLY